MIHRLLTATLIFIAIVVAAVDTSAQVRIFGRVTDADNKPVEFVTVRIAATAIGANTGLNGEYELMAAQQDTIKVLFSCLGYKDAERTLIDAKGAQELNVRMYASIRELTEVEVTEYKRQLSPVQEVNTKAYRLSPDVNGGSIESLITTMAGVNSSNEMSSQYSVRGGSYDENSVYINGIEIYRPLLISSGQQEGLSVINPDMVDKVKFSTGGFPVEYGDKMSSVLDITYRQPEALEGTASVSLMGGSASLGQSSRHFSQLHGVRYKRNASLLSTMETRGEYDPSFFDYQTNLNYRFSSQWQLSALGNVAVNDYRFTPMSRTTNFGTVSDAKQFKVYFDGKEQDRFETCFGAVTLRYKPSAATDFTMLGSGYLTNELVSYDISGEYWLDQAGTGGIDGVGGELGVGRYHEHARDRIQASVATLAFRFNTIAPGGHHISIGTSANMERVYERSREWELRDSAGFSLPALGDSLRMVYFLKSQQNITSNRLTIFGQDTYQIATDKGYLSINGGLRMSYWSLNREWLVSPRVNVGFVPEGSGQWSLRGAMGLYYQAPFYKELRMLSDNGMEIVLNRDVKSQRSWQVIAGTDYSFRMLNRPFKLSGETYFKLMSRLIPYEVNNLKVVYDAHTTSSGFAAGIDLKLFGQFVPGSDSWISFSLMKTGENLRGMNVPRPNEQRYSFALYFTDFFPRYPRLKINLRGVFADGLPTTAPRTTRDKGYFRTPAYKRADIGISYSLFNADHNGYRIGGVVRHIKSAWIGLDCFNLFDISNVNSYYWVTDVNEIQYAVPNYLTRRQLNLRLSLEF